MLASSRMHDRELMDVLLSYPATNRNCSMHSTRITPLHIVARDGIAELVEVLLDAGADINLQSASGEAAMHFACRESHVDVVRLLLERGAYPKLRAALVSGILAFGRLEELLTRVLRLLLGCSWIASRFTMHVKLDQWKLRSCCSKRGARRTQRSAVVAMLLLWRAITITTSSQLR